MLAYVLTAYPAVMDEEELSCQICGHWSCRGVRWFNKHCFLRHNLAFRANVGVSDARYETPLSTLVRCHICLIYIGDHSLEDHLTNAACLLVANAAVTAPIGLPRGLGSGAAETFTAALDARASVFDASGGESPVHGDLGDLNACDDDVGGALAAIRPPLDWIPGREDEISWGPCTSGWVGEVLLTSLYMFGAHATMPPEQRALDWKLYFRVRVVSVHGQVRSVC